MRKSNQFVLVLFFVLFVCFTQASAQMPKKQHVDTFGIALRMEYKKHLYPAVDLLTTTELAVFVLSPLAKPNASLRIIERNATAYIKVRILYKNVGAEVIKAFMNHCYKRLKLQTDSFRVEISDSFKTKMLDSFRKTVNQKIVDLYPNQITIYDGTSYNYWLNEGDEITHKSIREDGDAIYYGWHFAKFNLRIIDDVKKGVFDESKYEIESKFLKLSC